MADTKEQMTWESIENALALIKGEDGGKTPHVADGADLGSEIVDMLRERGATTAVGLAGCAMVLAASASTHTPIEAMIKMAMIENAIGIVTSIGLRARAKSGGS